MLSIIFEGDQNLEITADTIIKVNYTCIVECILSKAQHANRENGTEIKCKRKHVLHY